MSDLWRLDATAQPLREVGEADRAGRGGHRADRAPEPEAQRGRDPMYDRARAEAAVAGPTGRSPACRSCSRISWPNTPASDDRGLRLRRRYTPATDSELTRRLSRPDSSSSARPTPPSSAFSRRPSPAFGPTHNPWSLGRTPGGSSGGSAAAVAAGLVAMAHANDGGGSIRIPASCCGLFGLKPTRGAIRSGRTTATS